MGQREARFECAQLQNIYSLSATHEIAAVKEGAGYSVSPLVMLSA